MFVSFWWFLVIWAFWQMRRKTFRWPTPKKTLALPCWESKTNASGCHGIVLPGCFFLFFLLFSYFGVGSLWRQLYGSMCVFSFRFQTAITSPDRKKKAGDLHTMSAQRVVRFFLSLLKFIFSLLCVYVWTGVASKGRQPTTTATTAAATTTATPTSRYIIIPFLFSFSFFLFKNEEINKFEIKSCWFLLFSPAAPERNRRITI